MFREVPKEIVIGCTSRNKAPTYHHLKDLTSYCKISCLATKELYVEIVGPNSRTKNRSNIRIASLNLWDSPNASIIGLYTIAFGSIQTQDASQPKQRAVTWETNQNGETMPATKLGPVQPWSGPRQPQGLDQERYWDL